MIAQTPVDQTELDAIREEINAWLRDPRTDDGQPAFQPNPAVLHWPYYQTHSRLVLGRDDGTVNCDLSFTWSGGAMTLDVKLQIRPQSTRPFASLDYTISGFRAVESWPIKILGIAEPLIITPAKVLSGYFSQIYWNNWIQDRPGSEYEQWQLFLLRETVTPELHLQLQ